MKIFYASDLHIEFPENRAMRLANEAYDLAILAGDIGEGTTGIRWAADNFDIPVIYVPGNHEYYHHNMQALQLECRRLASELKVYYLERDCVVINGVKFAGCTLWTDYQANGTSEKSQEIALNIMPDHKLITYSNEGAYTPGHAECEHRKAVAWLSQQEGVDVVVTHHCPSLQAIGHRHPQNDYTPGFISELDHLIKDVNAKAWVFGHHHCAVDVLHESGTRILSNQHGYPEEDQTELGWNPEAYFEI